LFSALRFAEKVHPSGRAAPGLKILDTAARPSQVPPFYFEKICPGSTRQEAPMMTPVIFGSEQENQHGKES
jgi:hypothetical protein